MQSSPRSRWTRHTLLEKRLWPLWGALAGGIVGIVDGVYFSSWDLSTTTFGVELDPAVTLGFACNLALCGYALGRLAVARSRARSDHRTIEAQHRALVESQEALVQQEKLAALGRLVASIAHELRNPLGVIRSAAGVLREESDRNERQRRAAELVTEEVDHLNATITALLAFARPARLELRELEVDQVLERSRQLHEGRFPTPPRPPLVHRLAEPLPPVRGDFNLLAQVVASLLDNAAEAVTASGGERIELRASRRNGSVAIEVADDGPGIAGGDAGRVFEPFYTTKAKGTGLGLALAHRIADAHHGQLEVVDGAGAGPGRRGACLRLLLPAAEAGS